MNKMESNPGEKKMTAPKDDWRRQGQEKYLKGVTWTWEKYAKFRDDWDHDHCEFCSKKFMEGGDVEAETEGYTTEDNYRWVCKQCFEDFRNEFDWKMSSTGKSEY